jgi:hypothetical protein
MLHEAINKTLWRALRRDPAAARLRGELLATVQGRALAADVEAEDLERRRALVAELAELRQERDRVCAPLNAAFERARQRAREAEERRALREPDRVTAEVAAIEARAAVEPARLAATVASQRFDARKAAILAELRAGADPRIAEYARVLRVAGGNRLAAPVRAWTERDEPDPAARGWGLVATREVTSADELGRQARALFDAAAGVEALALEPLTSADVTAGLVAIRDALARELPPALVPDIPTLRQALEAAAARTAPAVLVDEVLA